MICRLLWVALIFRAFVIPVTAQLNEIIHVGSLFHNSDTETRQAYYLAADDIQINEAILPDNTLAIHAQEVPEWDVFSARRNVCEMLSDGVAAILGPAAPHIAHYVESILDHKEVPHLTGRWDDRHTVGSFQVNLYPYPAMLQEALADLIKELEWPSFTVIYDDYLALKKISNLIKIYDSRGPTVTVRQLDPGPNYRSLFLELKAIGETRFIIECSIEILYEVFKQLQQVGLMGSEHSYIVNSLDLWTVNLEPFQYSGTNITGFRIIDPDDQESRDVAVQLPITEYEGRVPNTIRLQAALMYDSVKVLATSLHNLMHPLLSFKNLSCDGDDNWEHGSSLINYIRMSEVKGLTGNIRFDNQGFRSDFELDIVELAEGGLRTVGSWRAIDRMNVTRIHPVPLQDLIRQENLFNKTLIVLIALTKPYGMLKEDTLRLSGNDRFEGFAIEMIHELSLMLNFNYTFEVQADNDYGSYNETTKQWSGMMRELLDKRVDLAITDLTITMERELNVDFTNPFMNLGISILYKRPQRLPPSLFSFMSPFSHDVWYIMFAAYVSVSILIFVMARITPKEWTNPYPCVEDPDELENQFSLGNSFWFTIGAFLQQGTEIAAIAPSTRMVSSIWWFFTLIMVSTYTANLAAFLTVESLSSPIRSVEDLANQKVIKYGAKRGGSTVNFFRNSSHPTYIRMWNQMQEWQDVFTKDNDEGVLRVQRENYAFFMESTSIEYIMERNCDVTQVGGLLDAKSYGIAMQKNSPLRNALSGGVLKLAELGKLHQMKTRWWKQKRGGGACSADKSGASEVDRLGLDNVGGVFVVLVLGCVVAVVACIVELTWTVHKICKKQGISFKQELIAHLMFAFSFKEAKPAQMTADEDNNMEETGSNQSLRGDGKPGEAVPRDNAVEEETDYGFRRIGPTSHS